MYRNQALSLSFGALTNGKRIEAFGIEGDVQRDNPLAIEKLYCRQ